MIHTTYKVLANSCFGRFAFPSEFVAKIFAQFPPSSSIGAKLFPRLSDTQYILTPTGEPNTSWNRYYVIQEIEPLTGEYQRVLADLYVRAGAGFHRFTGAYPFFATADMTTYYSLQDFSAYDWRTNTDIIRAALSSDLIGREFGSSLLRLVEVPIDCGFHIVNDAGREEVVVDFPV